MASRKPPDMAVGITLRPSVPQDIEKIRRGLAGAIGAEQTKDFAAFDVKGYVGDGLGFAKSFGDV